MVTTIRSCRASHASSNHEIEATASSSAPSSVLAAAALRRSGSAAHQCRTWESEQARHGRSQVAPVVNSASSSDTLAATPMTSLRPRAGCRDEPGHGRAVLRDLDLLPRRDLVEQAQDLGLHLGGGHFSGHMVILLFRRSGDSVLRPYSRRRGRPFGQGPDGPRSGSTTRTSERNGGLGCSHWSSYSCVAASIGNRSPRGQVEQRHRIRQVRELGHDEARATSARLSPRDSSKQRTACTPPMTSSNSTACARSGSSRNTVSAKITRVRRSAYIADWLIGRELREELGRDRGAVPIPTRGRAAPTLVAGHDFLLRSRSHARRGK